MTVLNRHVEPSDGDNPEHRALAQTVVDLGLPPGQAYTETVTRVVEHPDGAPAGLVTTTSAVVTNCPRRNVESSTTGDRDDC